MTGLEAAYFSFSPNNLPVILLIKCIRRQAGARHGFIVVRLIG